jgi:hypothetical protein
LRYADTLRLPAASCCTCPVIPAKPIVANAESGKPGAAGAILGRS